MEDRPPVTQTAVPQPTTWAVVCHLSALAGLVIPFGNLGGPLIVWLLKKDELPVVNDQGKESLNFQISITIYVIVAVILSFVAIGIPLLFALGIFDIVFIIIAAVQASKGIDYRYPLSIRLVK